MGLFSIVLAALIPTSVALSTPIYGEQRPLGTLPNEPTSSTLDVASAISMENSILYRQSRLATTPTIPIPTDIPMHDRLVELVALMPFSQQSTHDFNFESAVHTSPEGPLMSKSAAKSTLKVMVVGDSMTQGQQGDWTWRYRIWEWFRDQNVTVDFVGPYVGTQEPSPPKPPAPPPLYETPDPPPQPLRSSGGYAADVSAHFDSDHFSVWGRAAAVDKYLIRDVVAKHDADIMLIMLGFNDMGWFYSGPEGTLESMGTLVFNARAVNPNMKFALANVPQRRDLGREDLPVNTDIYNALLEAAIPRWATTRSPIELVRLRENYACELDACPAGYDGLHPNALGDYQIAQAFSRTLVNKFGVGSSALTLPARIPNRQVSVPASFKVVTSPGGILATWDAVYGAYGYDVRARIANVTGWSMGSVAANRYDASWTFDGFQYDIQVRATFGEDIESNWTSVKSAVAHPQTAPGPVNVDIRATATGMDISFDPPSGPYTDTIIEYNIIYWDKSAPKPFPGAAAFKSSPVHIDGLEPGHRYSVAITTWNAAGGGFPQFYRDVRIGHLAPSAPFDLQIRAIDTTTAHLSWTPVPEAAGYRIWQHRIDDESEPLPDDGVITNPFADVYQLSPGTQYHEFCVSSFNGNVESAHGLCVIAPSFATEEFPDQADALSPSIHGQKCQNLSYRGGSYFPWGKQWRKLLMRWQ